ncbi:MAG: TonB-dependent receptor domain-containing protein [Bryobacteraceae bacterium]
MAPKRFLAVMAAISVSCLSGQTVSTEIFGVVTDATGAAIPGAVVKVTRVATGDVRSANTNDSGNFIFPLLEIGQYEITCSAQGFKTEVARNVTIELQQKLRLDFHLQVGARAETVEVTAETPLLRTEDATLGSVIESKRVVELPLNGRNFAQLATLMPGVTFGTSRIGTSGTGGTPIPGQTVQIAANGQRDIQQRITIDGVVATEPRINTMSFTPSIEAIEEFKVQSAVYSAEYGVNSGAQVNVAIKSGTNSLHGTLFEFLRNDKFDARGFFLPPTQPKNELRRNQYGAVVSGPIKKDQTFWLFNWEARNERRATPSSTSVPTVAMRNGDFSELLQPNNRWYPNNTNPANLAIRYPGATAPFPNNIIPASLLNPVSLNLLTAKQNSPFPQGGYIPYPNNDAQAFAARSPINLFGTDNSAVDSNQFLGRVDHRFGSNDRIFGRYILVNATSDSIPLIRVTESLVDNRSQNLALGWTKIITPTIFNDLRYGYNRTHTDFKGPLTQNGFSQQKLGLDFRVVGDNNRTLAANEQGLPIISITGFSGIPYPREPGQLDLVYVHELSESLVVSRGAHNLKFGGLYSYNNATSERANVPRGALNFTRDITAIPDGFAAFMLGFPASTQTAEGQPFLTTLQPLQHRFGAYVLDDYKVNSRLTINMGIRWDFFGHVFDKDGKGRIRTLSFEPGKAATINGMFVPELIPNPGDGSPLYDINWKQIMPRLGVAYRITDKTVLRIGAGKYYNVNQLNNFQILNLQPPLSGSSVLQNDKVNPLATIDNPFAGAGGQAATALLMLGNVQPNGRSLFLNNDVWQWTAEVERTFGQNMVFGVAYVGNKGTHIDQTVSNYNNPDPRSRQHPGPAPDSVLHRFVESRPVAPFGHDPLSRYRADFDLQRAASPGRKALFERIYFRRFLQLPEGAHRRLQHQRERSVRKQCAARSPRHFRRSRPFCIRPALPSGI